jgi:anti-anti-sigma regulatory factor
MALRESAARTAGDVYLDMSELAFIDVDGLRMLVATPRAR